MHQSHYLSIFTFVRLTLFVSVSNLNEKGLTNRYKQYMHNKSDSTQIKQKNRIKPKRKDNFSDGINLYGYFGVTKQMLSTSILFLLLLLSTEIHSHTIKQNYFHCCVHSLFKRLLAHEHNEKEGNLFCFLLSFILLSETKRILFFVYVLPCLILF